MQKTNTALSTGFGPARRYGRSRPSHDQGLSLRVDPQIFVANTTQCTSSSSVCFMNDSIRPSLSSSSSEDDESPPVRRPGITVSGNSIELNRGDLSPRSAMFTFLQRRPPHVILEVASSGPSRLADVSRRLTVEVKQPQWYNFCISLHLGTLQTIWCTRRERKNG